MVSLKIGVEDSYDWPVEVRVPNRRIPGQVVTHTFTARFRALPIDDSRSMVAAADKAREDGRAIEAMELDRNILRDVVAGWSGLEEEYNADTLEEALNNPFFLTAFFTAYRKSISGEATQRRREKN